MGKDFLGQQWDVGWLALKNEWDLNIRGHWEEGSIRRQQENEFKHGDRDELHIRVGSNAGNILKLFITKQFQT